MTGKHTALTDLLKDAILEGGRQITWRSVDHYDWDAYYAAEQAFKAKHPGKRSWELRAEDGFPNYERDFKHEPPIVTENIAEPEEDEGTGYDQFREYLESSGDYGVDIEDLGTAYFVDSFGGEGEGDKYWYVFKLVTENPSDLHMDGKNPSRKERYFKADGYYASYDGGYYDELYEVFPKQVQVTEWTQG